MTRDAFRLQAELLKSGNYFARSSLASAFSERVRFNVDVSKIESNFQRKMVENDLNKRFVKHISTAKFDLLIYDPIDERFNLIVDTRTGSICTVSREFKMTEFRRTNSSMKIVQSASPEYYEYWEKGWQKFVSALKELGCLDRLRINKVYWAAKTERNEPYLPQFDSDMIQAMNIFLDRLYLRMEEDLMAQQFYVFPKELMLGADEHVWGKSPFHYIDDYYKKLMDYVLMEHR